VRHSRQESVAGRQAHNLKVEGSNPSPATTLKSLTPRTLVLKSKALAKRLNYGPNVVFLHVFAYILARVKSGIGRSPACLASTRPIRRHEYRMTQGAAGNFVEPMKALRVRELPVGNWLYELKFDGYWALAIKGRNEVRLLSRKSS
jgi:ATP-dependent DNA ligase